MPTSDAALPAAAAREDLAYAAALAEFRARHVPGAGREAVVEAYHAVRRMPYFSGPDRTPLAALRAGRGACTAKHLILRDLLRALGEWAEVELVEGAFGAGLPVAPDMPEALAALVRAGGVRDFHCRVVWDAPEGPLRLDATWPDDLEALGFPVDRAWCGRGDTRQAIDRVVSHGTAEDVLAAKALNLGSITREEETRRRTFLRLLSGWLEARS